MLQISISDKRSVRQMQVSSRNPARRELAERGPATAGTLVGAGDGHGVGKAVHRASKLQFTS